MSKPIQLPLKVITETAQKRGLDTGRWSPDDSRLAPVASPAETHELLVYLLEQDGDLPLAIIIGKYCQPFDFGISSRIARHCPTLRKAVERFIYFQTLAAPQCAYLEEVDDKVNTEVLVAPSPTLDPRLASSRTFRCVYPMVFTVANLRRLAADRTVRPKAVTVMSVDDGRKKDYEDFFDAPLTFDSDKNRIYFDSQTLDLRVKGADPGVIPYLEKLAFQEVERFGHRPGLGDKFPDLVRTKLEEEILQGRFDLTDLAQALQISERTLQRRLREEDLSFRSLVDEVKTALAIELLRAPEHSLQEIAHKLGYNHLASFNRAFKRWTDRPPGEFRELMTQEE